MDKNIFDEKINCEIEALNNNLATLVSKYRDEYKTCSSFDDVDELNRRYTLKYHVISKDSHKILNGLIIVEKVNPRYDEKTDMFIADLVPKINERGFNRLYNLYN